MNLAQLAEHAAERLGERMTLDFEGERFTNFQLLDQSRRFQAALEELGLGPGKIASLFMINHPLVFPLFQGIFRTGAAVVPSMFQLTAAELRFVLEDTKAEVVFTDTFSIHKVREAVKGLPHVRVIVVREGKDNPEANPPEIRLETLLTAPPKEKFRTIHDDDVAVMLYTSGTTGKPKGVMLTHTNLIASAEAANDAAELHLLEGRRVSLSAMPMAHIFGVAVMNSGYLIPDHLADSYGVQMKWFEPEKFMATLQQHRCTSMASVPTMLSLILNHPKLPEYDLSSLHEVVCGAAPLPVELAKTFMEKFGCRVREIYGMTENAGIGTANRHSEPYRPGSAGRPYFNCELRIVDDNDNPLPAGALGEIVTRGPATMKGYYNRPEATEEVMRGGWLHTGDIGYLDDDGHLFVVDRKKDMIIRGGENIYPAELEDVLYRHPGVAEAAVVGVPDPVYGEKVVAFVVPRAASNLTIDEILAYMGGQVTRFKVPGEIHLIESLPKSGVGKVLRRVLRDKAAESTANGAGGTDKS